nr:murein biosynthesis integral membrane protein MurJ [Steroidobacteraceae bacterium]
MSRGFLKSTGVVGSMTLLSRVTGLARDMVYSQAFGAGTLMDAFLVAFKIPNFLRRLTAEGAFSQAFVPVVSEFRIRRSHDEVRELVAGVSGTLGAALALLTLIGVLGAPLLVLLFAPGFRVDGERFDLTVDMLRLTFPYLFFISLVALASGILNSYGRFGLPAFTSTLLNVVMIVFAAWIAPYSSSPGLVLAAGVFVAGLVQLAVQLPALRRIGLLVRPRWGWAQEG